MGDKEQTILGLAGIIIGAIIYIRTRLIIPSLILVFIGILFILFRKEEDKLEKRKDKK